MSTNTIAGREKEINEIVKYLRAAEVGRLMLGELNGPMKTILESDYLSTSRAEIRQRRRSVRRFLKGEVLKFCRNNFEHVSPEDLGSLYDLLLENGCSIRIPLKQFSEIVGNFRSGRLDAPAHATVSLSPWGLQTDYPEILLAKDLALSFNDMLSADEELKTYHGISWKSVKVRETSKEVSNIYRRKQYSMRMCLLSCFNLCEAYINGLAWAHLETTDISALSNRQKDFLEGKRSLIERMEKVPAIVKGTENAPLNQNTPPLSEFRNLVKPFRDSIVHASPFSTPERFGGYDKLDKIYGLEVDTVRSAVDFLLEMIGEVNMFLTEELEPPSWLPTRENGRLYVE